MAKISSKKARLIVVKIGTGVLTGSRGMIDRRQIDNIAQQIAQLNKLGFQVILVSSGAIGSGMGILGLESRPKDLSTLQACATIGQPLLMQAYNEALAPYGMFTGQFLVTSWDLDSRKMYENTKATLKKLISLGKCVPIFNENDAMSFDEIAFGDNDRLSAHVTMLADAPLLVILSTIDGLRTHRDGSGKLIRRVRAINKKIEGYAGHTKNERSVGGMISKIQTAKMMMAHGIPMVIADGREPNVLVKILNGKRVGTWFEA